VGVFVKAAEERVVVEGVPEAVGDLFESNESLSDLVKSVGHGRGE